MENKEDRWSAVISASQHHSDHKIESSTSTEGSKVDQVTEQSSIQPEIYSDKSEAVKDTPAVTVPLGRISSLVPTPLITGAMVENGEDGEK